MLRKTQKKTLSTGILLTVLFFAMVMLSHVLADELVMPEEGEVPSIEAEEIEMGEQFFQEGEDGPAMRPSHPPIDQIPPMPMPEETDEPPVSTGPGEGVYYNSLTGEEIVVSVDDLSMPEELMQGGGYNGVDGNLEETVNMSADMTHITNTQSSPWRMNAKVVMRFEDSGGNSHYVTCSGTMRDSETVLTAGHCVYDYGGYGWAKEVWVYPGWDGVGGQFNPPPSIINHYGYGHGTYLGSWTGWTGSGDFNYDVGLVGVTRAVGMLTGWFGWACGGDCAWHLAKTYHNASYPAENCPISGLHNGSDMYYWYGNFNSCPSWNRLELTTTGGCFNAIWAGMSGSGAYYIDSDNRYVHGITSTSDRSTWGRYSRQWGDWVNWSNDTFIPNVRGSAFDLQALDCNAEPATIEAGQSTTLLNHLATNPTNGSASGTWTYRVYLSTNDNISSSDTLLSTQYYSWDFNVMSSVRVNMVQVTIPGNTPGGDYWIGLEYDSATDGTSNNNDTDGWDAVSIHVTPDTTPPTPNPMTWSTPPYVYSTSQIRMYATTASDLTGPIEYYFDFTSSPTGGTGGTDSGWQSSRYYADTGLQANHRYGYRVRARDGVYNGTGYSTIGYRYTLANLPGAAGFSNITETSIRANWTANGNSAGTQYYCQNITAGTNSGWITGTFWNSTGLNPGTAYTFQVKARNGDGVETGWTSLGSQSTLTGDICEGNFDGDNDVDGSDLAVFAADFGRTDCGTGGLPCEGNFDGDNDVDGSDLAVFAADFGRTDCP
jgi:hypothetical protein